MPFDTYEQSKGLAKTKHVGAITKVGMATSNQSDLLRQVADMIDSGQITGTLTETLTGLSVESFREGHQKVESSHMIGKLVISYS